MSCRSDCNVGGWIVITQCNKHVEWTCDRLGYLHAETDPDQYPVIPNSAEGDHVIGLWKMRSFALRRQ